MHCDIDTVEDVSVQLDKAAELLWIMYQEYFAKEKPEVDALRYQYYCVSVMLDIALDIVCTQTVKLKELVNNHYAISKQKRG